MKMLGNTEAKLKKPILIKKTCICINNTCLRISGCVSYVDFPLADNPNVTVIKIPPI